MITRSESKDIVRHGRVRPVLTQKQPVANGRFRSGYSERVLSMLAH